MDPTVDPTLAALGIDSSSLDSGGQVVGDNGNPSTGIDTNSLISQLLGNATQAYVANQAYSQPNIIVPALAPSGYVNIGGHNVSTITLFFLGAGILMFALVLRR